MKKMLAVLAITFSLWISETTAQSVLFDFDNAPLHSPFPIDLTVSGITAHFSANPAYYNYSIQRADALGFTPVGFAGYNNDSMVHIVFSCDFSAGRSWLGTTSTGDCA